LAIAAITSSDGIAALSFEVELGDDILDLGKATLEKTQRKQRADKKGRNVPEKTGTRLELSVNTSFDNLAADFGPEELCSGPAGEDFLDERCCLAEKPKTCPCILILMRRHLSTRYYSLLRKLSIAKSDFLSLRSG
jgi:hypothetical protein